MTPIKTLLASVALITGLHTPAHAGGVPTFDGATVASLGKQLAQLGAIEGVNQSQLVTLGKQLVTLGQQLKVFENTYGSITGARDAVANLFKGNLSEAQIAITFEQLRNVADLPDELKGRFKALDSSFGFVDGQQFFGDEDKSQRAAVFDLQQNAVKTEIVISDKVFEDAAISFEKYEGYREALGDASQNNDLKASIDLNTRVAIENGENLAKIMQMLATQSRSDAIADATSLRTLQQNVARLKFGEKEATE
jgi:hypothetical protein